MPRFVTLPDHFPNQMYQVYDCLLRQWDFATRTRSEAKAQREANRRNVRWARELKQGAA